MQGLLGGCQVLVREILGANDSIRGRWESHDIRNSVVLFIDGVSVLRMNSPICGWLRLVKPHYLHIYIYIVLIVKINITRTHTHFLHVTLTHAEITPVFAGKKVMLIFQHLVQHLKSWLVESPHLHKTI